MKLQDWENHDGDAVATMIHDVNEVIDLLKQAIETSDFLFVERAINMLELGHDEIEYDYNQFEDDE